MKNWRQFVKRLAPLSHPIRSKVKINRDSFAHVLPRFVQAMFAFASSFFSWLAKVVALVWVLQHQLSCPYIKPLFGIVLVNRRTPLLICSSGMDMIWSVYQLLRVANHNWNLANGLGCPCYTQLPLDRQIYDFLRGLNKNIWSLKRPSADPSWELSISWCLIIGKPALMQGI